jgi:acetyltransferase-like isoleucine patch superfamily enzyme
LGDFGRVGRVLRIILFSRTADIRSYLAIQDWFNGGGGATVVSWFKRQLKRILIPPLLNVFRLASREAATDDFRTLRSRLGAYGSSLEIVHPWDIRGIEFVFLGKDVFIGPEVLMIADRGAEIYLGNHVMLGPRVRVIANDHRFDDPSRKIKESGYGDAGIIRIGNDVWIGAGATILRGVTIADGSIVGAGAVLTKNVGPNEIWAGNPARKIRDRFPLSSCSTVCEAEADE